MCVALIVQVYLAGVLLLMWAANDCQSRMPGLILDISLASLVSIHVRHTVRQTRA
jgi:hypothetical protein